MIRSIKSYLKLGSLLLLFLATTSFNVGNEYFKVTFSNKEESIIINIDSDLESFECTIHGKNINHKSKNQKKIVLPRFEKGIYHIVLYHSKDKYLIKTIEL